MLAHVTDVPANVLPSGHVPYHAAVPRRDAVLRPPIGLPLRELKVLPWSGILIFNIIIPSSCRRDVIPPTIESAPRILRHGAIGH